jgi:putative hydrolase of the HAD superfamily
VLEKLGLGDLFSAVYDIDFFAYRPKPRPEIYRELLVEIGGDPRTGVMVDDMAVNLKPAADLGLRTFHYVPGCDPVLVKSPIGSLQIASLRQLYQLLLL